jgi:5-formyltetrahydrofolate cyclo-ligase
VNEGDNARLAKRALRNRLRAARKAHALALDPRVAALVLMRPPAALLALIPDGATVGLYLSTPGEAPTAGYARHFYEAGHTLALPAFAAADSAMAFRRWDSPYLDDLLEPGPFALAQPPASAALLVPEVLLVPLVGFTAQGARLGQGGGHYDRWLAANPATIAIGMAWDCQLVDSLPREPHDQPLTAVVTPTRFYGPFGGATHA